jgi:hypothetical protein
MRFIEFEGFQIRKGQHWIIKELCVLDERNYLSPLYYLFESDFPFNELTQDEKIQVGYVTGHIHGINWNEGSTRFCASCVQRQIIESFGSDLEFYTMGEQKVALLTNLFPKLRFCHVGDERSFKTLPSLMPHITCLHRKHGEHCAVRKCYRLLQSFYVV